MSDKCKTYNFAALVIATFGLLLVVVAMASPWWTIDKHHPGVTAWIGLHYYVCVGDNSSHCTWDFGDVQERNYMQIDGTIYTLDICVIAALVGIGYMHKMWKDRALGHVMNGQKGTALLIVAGLLGVLASALYAVDYLKHVERKIEFWEKEEVKKGIEIPEKMKLEKKREIEALFDANYSLGASFALSVAGAVALLLSGCVAGVVVIMKRRASRGVSCSTDANPNPYPYTNPYTNPNPNPNHEPF